MLLESFQTVTDGKLGNHAQCGVQLHVGIMILPIPDATTLPPPRRFLSADDRLRLTDRHWR
jgi:hypothetical protein